MIISGQGLQRFANWQRRFTNIDRHEMTVSSG